MINRLTLFRIKNKWINTLWHSIFQSKMPGVAAFLSLMVLAGCATDQAVRLPAVSSDANSKAYVGKFVWIDLVTEDVQAASAFYRGLFGWRPSTSKESKDYYVLLKDGKPIGGMVAAADRNEEAPESLWLVSLSVDDVDRAAARVGARGGKVVEGPLNAGERGRMALVSDPAGASFILLRAPGGDPVDTEVGTGEWLWTDLFTQNAKKAAAFYTYLSGYKVARVAVKEGHHYNVLIKGGRPRAGIVELRWAGLKDNWLPYFRVDDLDRAIEKARRLGGRLVLQSEDAALLSDPTGAVFGVQVMAQRRSK